MYRLQSLQPILKDTLLKGDIFREHLIGEKLDEKNAEKYFYQFGSPKLWIYCGFTDGLHLSMPGYLDQSGKYDPRTREWYIKAARKTPFDDVVWGKPYFDIISKRLTLSASLPIFVNKKLCGVIAVDNMLQYISRFMKKNGNTELFLLEKVIIDDVGRVLLSTREDYSVQKDEKEVHTEYNAERFFDDKKTFDIIRERKNGILNVRTRSNRNIVYLFYRINTHDWHYVEKIDMDMLLDSIAEEQKNKKSKE